MWIGLLTFLFSFILFYLTEKKTMAAQQLPREIQIVWQCILLRTIVISKTIVRKQD